MEDYPGRCITVYGRKWKLCHMLLSCVVKCVLDNYTTIITRNLLIRHWPIIGRLIIGA